MFIPMREVADGDVGWFKASNMRVKIPTDSSKFKTKRADGFTRCTGLSSCLLLNVGSALFVSFFSILKVFSKLPLLLEEKNVPSVPYTA